MHVGRFAVNGQARTVRSVLSLWLLSLASPLPRCSLVFVRPRGAGVRSRPGLRRLARSLVWIASSDLIVPVGVTVRRACCLSSPLARASVRAGTQLWRVLALACALAGVGQTGNPIAPSVVDARRRCRPPSVNVAADACGLRAASDSNQPSRASDLAARGRRSHVESKHCPRAARGGRSSAGGPWQPELHRIEALPPGGPW